MKDNGEKLSLQEEGMKAFPEEQRAQQTIDSATAFSYALERKKQLDKELLNEELKKGNHAIIENCELRKKIVGLEDENEDLKKTQVALRSAVAQVSIALAQQIIDLKKDCKEWENIANMGYYKEFRAEQAKVEALEQDLAKYKAFYDYFKEVMYMRNMEIAFYHDNGNFEPFDNFYNQAIELMEQAAQRPTIDVKA